MIDLKNEKRATLSEQVLDEKVNEASLIEGKLAEEAKEAPKLQESTAIGDEKITIIKHKIYIVVMHRIAFHEVGAELVIRNISESTIATAVFEAIFYDIEDNIIDTVKHKEIYFKPNTSRTITICSSTKDPYKVERYDVRLVRVTTADVERVQIRRNVVKTTETGEEEVTGIIKNISTEKTDAALIATFQNNKGENIGKKCIVLRDIEPNSLRQFHFKFKPQESDRIKAYSLDVVCDVEEQGLHE